MKPLAIRSGFDFCFFLYLGFQFRVWVFMLLGFPVLGILVLESKKSLALRRDLSMSKDIRDPMRENVGFAANMFYFKTDLLKCM